MKKIPFAGDDYDEVPFDLYCPSMQEKLKKGICSICNRYWPSAAAMIRHKKCHRKAAVQESEVNEESDLESESNLDSSDHEVLEIPKESSDDVEVMPVFKNIFEVLASPFVEEE